MVPDRRLGGKVKTDVFGGKPIGAVYITPTEWGFTDRVRSLVDRARGDSAARAPAVRQALWSVDKDQRFVPVATMDALVAASGERRYALILFEACARVDVLAAIGIYVVLSGSVTERMRVIGVRSALGVSRVERGRRGRPWVFHEPHQLLRRVKMIAAPPGSRAISTG